MTASVRIRPIRFGFVVDPGDLPTLRKVFQVNTVLWGGVYNFIIPAFRRVPARYRERYGKNASAKTMVNGLVDAFQPDFLVETKHGAAAGLVFDGNRIISMEQLTSRDDRGRCAFGIDVRSLCADLYRDTYRFVQRHPLKVVVPHPTVRRYDMLFAAAFGEFPSEGPLADCLGHYSGAFDAKDETISPKDIHSLFSPEYLYPLRIGRHELETSRSGWAPDPMLFFMDERSPYDLIEYWNLRAIGWRIAPLPVSLSNDLKSFCEKFISDAHKPYPPPSNAFHMASFLCSRSFEIDRLQSFVGSLKRSIDSQVSIDPRVPRLWEEWGRSADHAEPQVVTHQSKPVDAHVLGSGFHIRTALPKFITDFEPFGAGEHACANVLESVPGGAEVIPWQTADMRALSDGLGDRTVWLGREGIVTTAGEYRKSRFLRAPSPINVFSSFMQAHALKMELSSAGRVCEQVITALGGLHGIGLVASEDLLRLLDRLAHGDLELEISDDEDVATTPKRRVRSESVPYSKIQEVLGRTHAGDGRTARGYLDMLLRSKVLTLGLKLPCPHCTQRSWYSLEDLASNLQCRRCLGEFPFPSTKPPRDAWEYRVFGPFAVENFAEGSYCVAATLRFLSEEVASSCSWIPSFNLTGSGAKAAEADFGMFLRQNVFSHVRGPLLVLGECKTFGVFEKRDFRRARNLARLFPGATLCFATLRQSLKAAEKKAIAAIARAGRQSLKTGQQTNPVLVLTGTELFGQFKHPGFVEAYGSRSEYARSVFYRRDLQEVCDFTQHIHLGMETYHEWLDAKRRKRLARLASASGAAP